MVIKYNIDVICKIGKVVLIGFVFKVIIFGGWYMLVGWGLFGEGIWIFV